ncbi:MAG: SMC-Scp complex subunit ScpB [Planctomycetota bacterium]
MTESQDVNAPEEDPVFAFEEGDALAHVGRAVPAAEEDDEALSEERSARPSAGAEEGLSNEEDLRTEIDLPLENVVEALLLSVSDPQTAAELAHAAGQGVRAAAVRAAVENLNAYYAAARRAFEIVRTGDRYQLMTLPEYAAFVSYLVKRPSGPKKLTPASLDTLAIVAYKQPIMRVDIERIRGVACGPVLRGLIELGLVRVVGKNTEVLGHPMLYGTTERFLEQFGIVSLDALPSITDLRNPFNAQGSSLRDTLPEST